MPDWQPNAHVVLALDIGGTKTTAAIGTVDGEILSQETVDTRAKEGFERAWEVIADLTGRVLAQNNEQISSIAVSIGGPVDASAGMILSPPNLPGWDEIPLKKLLEEKFNLSTEIEHDAKAGALAENYFGVAKSVRNFVFLTVGTGIGAGALIDGRLARGNRDNFGEVGHWRLADSGPALYGKPGSWEGTASGAGVSAMATEADSVKFPAGTGANVVFNAARAGDATAQKVVGRFSESLGRGVALIVDLMAPELIVLGSLGVRTGDLILEKVQSIVNEESSSRNLPCPVVPSGLGEDLGILAPLAVARARKIEGMLP